MTVEHVLWNGKPPNAGDRVRLPALARTLRHLASDGRDDFYNGFLAADLVDSVRRLGGRRNRQDFADCTTEYVTPISARFLDLDMGQIPPNGQGIAALVLSGFDMLDMDPTGPERFHFQVAFQFRSSITRQHQGKNACEL